MWKKKIIHHSALRSGLSSWKSSVYHTKGVQIPHRKGTIHYAGVCYIFILGVLHLYFRCYSALLYMSLKLIIKLVILNRCGLQYCCVL